MPQRFVLSAEGGPEADNTNHGLSNSSYSARTEFNNCLLFIKRSVNLSFEEAICVFTVLTKPA